VAENPKTHTLYRKIAKNKKSYVMVIWTGCFQGGVFTKAPRVFTQAPRVFTQAPRVFTQTPIVGEPK
jgi:hypothetical protein